MLSTCIPYLSYKIAGSSKSQNISDTTNWLQSSHSANANSSYDLKISSKRRLISLKNPIVYT